MNPERYPLDFDALNKGDVLTPESLARITSTEVGTPAYQFAILGLRCEIERELEAAGRPVTVKQDGDGLRILTDEEATDYNHAQLQAGLRKVARSHRRNLLVDRTQLSIEKQKAHDRRLIAEGAYVQSIAETRKRLPVLPHQRTVPGIPGAGSCDRD